MGGVLWSFIVGGLPCQVDSGNCMYHHLLLLVTFKVQAAQQRLDAQAKVTLLLPAQAPLQFHNAGDRLPERLCRLRPADAGLRRWHEGLRPLHRLIPWLHVCASKPTPTDQAGVLAQTRP